MDKQSLIENNERLDRLCHGQPDEVAKLIRKAFALGLDLGWANHEAARSNIAQPKGISKAEQREFLARETKGKRPSNIPKTTISLEELGL